MEQNDVVMQCCVCKRIKTDVGWNYEFVSIDDNTIFSHGYCPVCYKRALRDIEVDAFVNALEVAR